jgi:hypothetical protein
MNNLLRCEKWWCGKLCCGKWRRGKIERVQVILFPPLIFIGGIILYNTYLTFSPPALTIVKTEQVEALEVINRISPNRKNGLLLPQAQSLVGGGSSRLAVARPALDGAFILVQGFVNHTFLYEKSPPDRMFHISIGNRKIRVESDGQPVAAILLLPRYETAPLRIEGIALTPDQEILSRLFTDQTILPVPAGELTGGKFVSNNGMTVDTGIGADSSALSLGGIFTLDITIDPESTAWVEMSKNTRVIHMAVGNEDLNIGLLIPHDGDPTKTYQVFMFDEQVATVSLNAAGG